VRHPEIRSRWESNLGGLAGHRHAKPLRYRARLGYWNLLRVEVDDGHHVPKITGGNLICIKSAAANSFCKNFFVGVAFLNRLMQYTKSSNSIW
jgi:hypothetical protein